MLHGCTKQRARASRLLGVLILVVGSAALAEPQQKKDVGGHKGRIDSMLAKSKVVSVATGNPGADGSFEQHRLVKTDLKYPRVIIKQKLKKDPATGKETIVATEAMAADHLIVKMRPGVKREKAATMAQGKMLRKLHSSDAFLLNVPVAGPTDLDRVLADLRRNRDVLYAEPDYLVFASTTDPLFAEQWGLKNTGQDGGVVGADIDAETAWGTSTGSPSVVVGVIDTGIDYTHPDLAANMWINSGEDHAPLGIVGPEDIDGIDDDNNGFVDDLRGWNFSADNNDPYDDCFHGTHVAGTIGAVTNNGLGVAGVAWQVKLMALKFLDANGSGYTSDALDAIRYATEKGVLLTSNSWGGYFYSLAEKDAIEEANAAGILFVCAAGNDAADLEMFMATPPRYNTPNMITVAAVDRFDELAYFSNFGRETVHLGAPGVDIMSTMPTVATDAMLSRGRNTYYDMCNGTSMATPHVSGVCALLKAQSADLIGADIKMAVLTGATPIPALQNFVKTGARLNAAGAVNALSGEQLYVKQVVVDDDNYGGTSGNDNGFAEPGETVGFSIRLRNGGFTAASGVSATLVLQQSNPSVTITNGLVQFGDIAALSESQPVDEFLVVFDAAMTTPGDVLFTLTITDQAQNTWTETLARRVGRIGTVSGVVTVDGQPASGTYVWYKGPSPDAPDCVEWRKLTTDATGAYSVTIVEPGATFQVMDEGGRIPSDAVFVSVPPDQPNVNFAFFTFTVSGTVTSAQTGLPMPGASVHLCSTIDTLNYDYTWDGLNESLTADANGNYSYTRLTGRQFPLGVYAKNPPKYLASALNRMIVSGGSYSANLQLSVNNYVLEDIGPQSSGYVYGLSNPGWLSIASGSLAYIRTPNGQMHLIGDISPYAMNDLGHIAGVKVVNNEQHLMFFADANDDLVVDPGELQDLGADAIAGGQLAHMNNYDQVVSGSKLYLPTPAYGLSAGVHDLYTLELWTGAQNFHGINDFGQIVGTHHHPVLSSVLGFIWEEGSYFNLQNFGLPYCDPYNEEFYHFYFQEVTDINNSGACTGCVSTPVPESFAYIFQDSNQNSQVDAQEVKGLPLLPGPGAGWGTGCVGSRLNEQGDVTGYGYIWDATLGDYSFQDVIWLGGGLVKANELIDPAWGWHVTGILDVNNSRQILAAGTNPQGESHYLLLSPSRTATPTLLSVVSRRQYGNTSINVPLPVAEMGVEPRNGGVQKLVFTFDQPVNAADGVLDDEVLISTGQISSLETQGSTVIANVSGIANQSCVTVRVERLRTVACSTMVQPIVVNFYVLASDVDADGIVTAADVSLITQRLGQRAQNYPRLDTDLSGFVDNNDVLLANAAIGQQAICSPTVLSRLMFYNNSYYDGNNPAANAQDDAAIASDKVALLPGQTALLPAVGPMPTNYISYDKSINGVMVDILGLPGTPTAADFEFTNTGRDFTGSALAASPLSISVRAGAGVGGSDRITIIWADNAIPNSNWLKVKVKATANTGLASDDVFYFGVAIGESFQAMSTGAVVNAIDVSATKAHPHKAVDRALVTDEYDHNRDSLVDTTDIDVIRTHYTGGYNALMLITAP